MILISIKIPSVPEMIRTDKSKDATSYIMHSFYALRAKDAWSNYVDCDQNSSVLTLILHC
jgi:hypothetical protein